MHLKIWSWWPCGALIEREKRPGLSGEYKDSKGGRETRFSLRREERGEERRGDERFTSSSPRDFCDFTFLSLCGY
jgi:hypothetical protein